MNDTKRTVYHSSKYNKDYRKASKQGKNMKLLDDIIIMLANDVKLPRKYKDHSLKGKYKGFRECHIEQDWLLVYRKIDKNILELYLFRTGSHAELFR